MLDIQVSQSQEVVVTTSVVESARAEFGGRNIEVTFNWFGFENWD